MKHPSLPRRAPGFRLGLLLALGGSVVAFSFGACRRGEESPPVAQNVVFLLLDTLRADHLSAYGYARATSPNLDQFGREHLRFADARSQASCTFPSVNSMLTSRWPSRFLGQPERRIGIPNEFDTLGEILGQRGFQTAAISASTVVRKSPSHHNPHGGFDRGFDRFDEDCLLKRARCVNREATAELDSLREPFFLYLHYLDPHSGYDPPKPFRWQFVPPFWEPKWVARGNPLPVRKKLQGENPDFEYTRDDIAKLAALYDAEIAYLDAELGRLFADLAARGLFERTIVVVAADHGEEFLEHGDMLHCGNVYDTSAKVPLFAHFPGVERKGTVAGVANNLDLAPTILDYLGFPIPAAMEGKSLRPLIERGEEVHAESFSLQGHWRSATDGQAKLVWNQEHDRYELFHLGSDPGETQNVLANDRRTFHRLRDALRRWLEATEGAMGGEKSRQAADEAEDQLKALGYLQ